MGFPDSPFFLLLIIAAGVKFRVRLAVKNSDSLAHTSLLYLYFLRNEKCLNFIMIILKPPLLNDNDNNDDDDDNEHTDDYVDYY